MGIWTLGNLQPNELKMFNLNKSYADESGVIRAKTFLIWQCFVLNWFAIIFIKDGGFKPSLLKIARNHSSYFKFLSPAYLVLPSKKNWNWTRQAVFIWQCFVPNWFAKICMKDGGSFELLLLKVEITYYEANSYHHTENLGRLETGKLTHHILEDFAFERLLKPTHSSPGQKWLKAKSRGCVKG